MTSAQVTMELVGGTVRRTPARGFWRSFRDGTVPIGAGSAFSAAFAPSAIAAFVTDDEAGRWLFVGLAAAALALVFVGVFVRRWNQLRSSAGVVAVIADSEGEPGRLLQDRWQAERQLDQDCTAAVTVSSTVTAPESEEAAATVDQVARQVVQALNLAERIAQDVPGVALAPMMRLHMAFRLGARLGHTFPRELVLMDKRQDRGLEGFFPAVRLRADDPVAGQLDVSYTTIDDAGQDRAALALDLQGFGQDFLAPVRVACQRYGYRHLLVIRTRGVRLDSRVNFAYQSVVDEICHVWRDNEELPASARNGARGIFLSGPPSIAVALGARLAYQHDLWTPYRYVRREGEYRPLPPPARGGS